MNKHSSIAVIALMSFFINSCARNPVSGKRQVVLMSEEQELSMGKEADPQIIAQYGLYKDSSLQNFITAKGKQMAAISHRNNIDYQFRIVDSDVLNAFAVPGGYVYFTRGIMAHFNNEAEFAGVLGHEIGHITARHSVTQQRNALLGQIGLMASMVIKPQLAEFAEQASQGLSLLFLKFGRDAERQADQLGVEYSTKIGYDAAEMAGFFKTLQRKSTESGAGELPPFLSTHPDPGDRNVAVAKSATEWKQQLKLTNAHVNRNSYLKGIEGLIYGEDPQQGFLENNVFYHPGLKFQFPVPQGWAYQNNPQSVQMAPKDGKALMMFTLVPGKSLQEAAETVLKQYNLQSRNSENITVNGLRAITMIADQVPQQQANQQQQQQEPVRTLNYIIEYGGNYYHIVGLSSGNDFSAYTPYFTNTMQGFRVVTDPSIINRKPERVRIKTANKAGTLEQQLQQHKVPAKRLEEMAILNGMALKNQLTAGTLFKVIEK
jgi:predicted Zn-dependent protease